MAEGYARVTGKVGVVIVTSGPGATNVVTPLQDALMDGTLIFFLEQPVQGLEQPVQGISVFLLTTNMRLFLNLIINDIFSPILICEKPLL